MILISHRGNIDGRIIDKENNPEYVMEALSYGYDVEVDVWYMKGWWLGHDVPQYKCTEEILHLCWCHAKNKDALIYAKNINLPKYFWHENDSYTMTSNGYIWTHSNAEPIENAILVMPEIRKVYANYSYVGICSDYIKKYKI